MVSGGVKITLQSGQKGFDEKAEVSIALPNADNAVEKVLKSLAERFPAESVLTITPGSIDSRKVAHKKNQVVGRRSTEQSVLSAKPPTPPNFNKPNGIPVQRPSGQIVGGRNNNNGYNGSPMNQGNQAHQNQNQGNQNFGQAAPAGPYGSHFGPCGPLCGDGCPNKHLWAQRGPAAGVHPPHLCGNGCGGHCGNYVVYPSGSVSPNFNAPHHNGNMSMTGSHWAGSPQHGYNGYNGYNGNNGNNGNNNGYDLGMGPHGSHLGPCSKQCSGACPNKSLWASKGSGCGVHPPNACGPQCGANCQNYVNWPANNNNQNNNGYQSPTNRFPPGVTGNNGNQPLDVYYGSMSNRPGNNFMSPGGKVNTTTDRRVTSDHPNFSNTSGTIPFGKDHPDASKPPVSHVSYPDGGLMIQGPYGPINLAPGFEEYVVSHPNGDKIRYVEVGIEEERFVEVPVLEVKEREIIQKVPEYQTVEKIEEVVEYVKQTKHVDVEKIEEVIRKVPVKQVIDVPTEVIVEKEIITRKPVERIVEIPEIIEVPKVYDVEKKVQIDVYENENQHCVVAQKLTPTFREKGKMKVDTITYEPVLYAIDVYIPKPVTGAIGTGQKINEFHSLCNVPAAQYNSLLKSMNPTVGEQFINEISLRTVNGHIPMLPPGELAEVVIPRSDARDADGNHLIDEGRKSPMQGSSQKNKASKSSKKSRRN